jgi:hypothetical protein
VARVGGVDPGGEAYPGRPRRAGRQMGRAAPQPSHLCPPSEYLPRRAGHVGRARRFGATGPQARRPREPQDRGPQRLRVLTGYHAAVGSELGIPDEKILALEEYATSPLYDDQERVALEYADAITLSDRDVDEGLFERVRGGFDEDAVVELTAVIAWKNSSSKNSSSKFNRAMGVPSQGRWKREDG